MKKTIKAWAVLSNPEIIATHTRMMDGEQRCHLSISEDKDTALMANMGSVEGIVPCTITYTLPAKSKKPN